MSIAGGNDSGFRFDHVTGNGAMVFARVSSAFARPSGIASTVAGWVESDYPIQQVIWQSLAFQLQGV